MKSVGSKGGETARARKSYAALAPFLERLYSRYHDPRFLGTDPLALVREFEGAEDREAAALFAALLAYGNVKQIQRSLRLLFAAMDNRPGPFVRKFSYEEAARRLDGWKHRFTEAEDVLCLAWLLHQVIARHGSLEKAFALGYDAGEADLVGAASRFIDLLLSGDFAPGFERERMLAKSSFKHLLPRPDRGSACKRFHLFLRWVIRPGDGIDLGLWRSIPPVKLLVPVDTHVLRISQNLGLVARRAPGDLRAARAITEALRAADPQDPVRFDFALCRIGIIKACPTAARLEMCSPCELHAKCARRRQLERSAARRLKTRLPVR